MKPKKIEKIYKGGILAAIAVALSLLTGSPARAQDNDKEKLLRMMEEDRSTMDAIAGYDNKVQGDILQLAQTPEVLNIMQDLQKKSEIRFRDIIVPYDRDVQAAMYDLSRYPDLISNLVRNGKPSAAEVNAIVLKYPSDIQETAKKYARSYYEALVKIDNLNNEIDRDFQSYLSPYDDQTRNSVNDLLKYPEIVTVMVEDKDFTQQLGVTYREDPQWVTDQLDRISAELDEQNKKDVADYQKQVESDPEAYSEMLSAAEEFAAENNSVRSEDAYVDPEVDVTIRINSYPFWFGYPYWYPYAYWRPYPAYYHTGFYFGPGRRLIFIGLPSAHFIYWQTHYHPALYPHLSYCYYNYYHSHYLPYHDQWRRPVSNYAFYRSVERNVINNPRVNNDNLVRIDRRRGNNIVRRPETGDRRPVTEVRRTESGARSYSRGSSTVRQGSVTNETIRRGSVRRDAFPRTTPSNITPKTSGQARQGGVKSYRNEGTIRSGKISTGANRVQRPSSSGSNQPARIQNNGNRRIIQQKQSGSSVNSPQLRNYRNYRATEPRQAAPAPARREIRSAPSHAAPSGGRAQASYSRGNQSHSSRGRSNDISRKR